MVARPALWQQPVSDPLPPRGAILLENPSSLFRHSSRSAAPPHSFRECSCHIGTDSVHTLSPAPDMPKHKRITLENWRQPDPASSVFTMVNRLDGSVRPITPEDYVAPALEPQLVESVPEEVRDLYEVARGALAYGFYFYPLFTLATDQSLRVVEAAVEAKARAMGCPRKVSTFDKLINWLGTQGAIPGAELDGWHELRRLRNESSHPRHQHIFPPAAVFGMFRHVAELVNSLFPAVPAD